MRRTDEFSDPEDDDDELTGLTKVRPHIRMLVDPEMIQYFLFQTPLFLDFTLPLGKKALYLHKWYSPADDIYLYAQGAKARKYRYQE